MRRRVWVVEFELILRDGFQRRAEAVFHGHDVDAHQHRQGLRGDVIGALGRASGIQAQVWIVLFFEQRFGPPGKGLAHADHVAPGGELFSVRGE
jgi:hypothetical protein